MLKVLITLLKNIDISKFSTFFKVKNKSSLFFYQCQNFVCQDLFTQKMHKLFQKNYIFFLFITTKKSLTAYGYKKLQNEYSSFMQVII